MTNKTLRILLVVCILFIGVFWFYASYFNGGISVDHKRWGEFGGYLGGVMAPVLSFVSIYLILENNKEQQKRFNKQQENFSYEIKLRTQLEAINRIESLLFEKFNKQYKMDEANKIFHACGKSLSESNKMFKGSLFQIFKKVVDDCSKDMILKCRYVDSVLIVDIETFSAQLKYYLLLLDELHGNADNYHFNISVVKYKLSLFSQTLPILRKLGFVDDVFLERYLTILFLPYQPNKVILKGSRKLMFDKIVESEVAKSGITDFNLAKATLKTKIIEKEDTYQLEFQFIHDQKMIRRTPKGVSEGEWQSC